MNMNTVLSVSTKAKNTKK